MAPMKRNGDNSRFETTKWSIVLRAGGGDAAGRTEAFGRLCHLYWRPLFVYCLGKGMKTEDAEDLTQSFFAWMISRETLRVADPERGRFRGFLLTTFKHFIAGEWDRARAARRGGGVTHVSFDVDFRNSQTLASCPRLSPERAFDRQWALDLVGRAMAALEKEHQVLGKSEWFDRIVGPGSGASYLVLAADLETTEDAIKSFAKRARRRFRDLLEREIADTVDSPEEAADEMLYLSELLRG